MNTPPGQIGGVFVFHSRGAAVDDTFLACLRCPIDPSREATVSREDKGLRCSGCGVVFPIKQTLPVLVPEEAIFPGKQRGLDQLPCRRAHRD
jgi:uncharacterized protein YbaR (Trm112 family)